ncbi:MAG TPA: hypothetical protein VGV61_04540 [Thermoanaerobaculia bacterium]|nr:hypothetical protein [Thermoanaerobaculia bacterium]
MAGHHALELAAEALGLFTDEIDAAHLAPDQRQQLVAQAGALAAAAEDEVDAAVGEALEGPRRGADVGALAVVEEAHAGDLAHRLGTVRQPDEGAQARRQRVSGRAGGERQQRRRHGVLQVVRSRQRHVADAEQLATHAAHLHHRLPLEGAAVAHHAVPRENALARRHRERRHRRVVGVEHRHVALVLAQEDAPLGRRIARHVGVTVEVVGRQVEQRRGVGAEGVGGLELEARQLDDEGAPGRAVGHRGQRQADVAAHLDGHAGVAQQVAGHRRRRALAVAAGDPHHRPLQEGEGELDFGDHRHTAVARRDQQRPIAGHPRREHHAVELDRQRRRLAARQQLEAVVGEQLAEVELLGRPRVHPHHDDTAPAQEARRRGAREAEPVDEHAPPGAGGPGNVHQRVALISASRSTGSPARTATRRSRSAR